MADNEKLDMYSLYRCFWDYAFCNPERIKPNHAAVYSFSIEHCNRLGWKEKFGFPSSMAMEATGIKSYSVYKKTFDDLVNFGFYEIIEYSKNQYSSNIIALKENCKANAKAPYKALDKALTKHLTKQTQSTSESTIQSTSESIVSIDIPIYNNTIYNNTIEETDFCSLILSDIPKYLSKFGAAWTLQLWQMKAMVEDFQKSLKATHKKHVTLKEYGNHFANWGKTRFLNYQQIPDPDAELRQHELELQKSREHLQQQKALIDLRQKEYDEREANKNKG